MEVNLMLTETLIELFQYDIAKASMFSNDERYAHPPFVKFKVSNSEFENCRINALARIIDDFKGNLSWALIKRVNFLIIPVVFKDFNSYRDCNPTSDNCRLIDLAIDDIPNLTKWIRVNFPLERDF